MKPNAIALCLLSGQSVHSLQVRNAKHLEHPFDTKGGRTKPLRGSGALGGR